MSLRTRALPPHLPAQWRDASKPKWQALDAWRKSFKAEHGREPRVWIDKCCVDQQAIDESLKCLPVFLAGCAELIVLIGPTYLKRLWCAIEMYTFLAMGGATEQIKFLSPAPYTVCPEVNALGLERSFESFDVREARCCKQLDEQRLLGVVETGFSGIDGVNQYVCSLQHIIKGDHAAVGIMTEVRARRETCQCAPT